MKSQRLQDFVWLEERSCLHQSTSWDRLTCLFIFSLRWRRMKNWLSKWRADFPSSKEWSCFECLKSRYFKMHFNKQAKSMFKKQRLLTPVVFYGVYVIITKTGMLKTIVAVHENHIWDQLMLFRKVFPAFSTAPSSHYFRICTTDQKVKNDFIHVPWCRSMEKRLHKPRPFIFKVF